MSLRALPSSAPARVPWRPLPEGALDHPSLGSLSSRRRSESFAVRFDSVRYARAFAAKTLANWSVVSDHVIQVVGELAAEAVREAPAGAEAPLGQFVITLTRVPHGVLVQVSDERIEAPFADCAGVYARGERARQIVRRLARRWGWVSKGDARTIWAEVPVHRRGRRRLVAVR